MTKASRWIVALAITTTIVVTFYLSQRSTVPPASDPAHPQSVLTSPKQPIAKTSAPVSEPPKTGPDTVPEEKERKFAEIDVLKRKAILTGIARMEHAEIFRLWLAAGRIEHDFMKQSAIGTKLAIVMREGVPSITSFDQLHAFVMDSSNSMDERRKVIGLLGFASTRESIELLLALASTLRDEDLRYLAITGIRGSGQMLDSQKAERLVPLVKTWKSSSDPKLLQAVSTAMAEIGAPEGVVVLLSSVALEQGANEVHASAAKTALLKVYADQAVVPVAEFLNRQTAFSPSSMLAAKILVNIGSAEAGGALLSWLQTAEDEVATEAFELVTGTRSPVLLKVWSSVSDQSRSFRSEKVRQAIQNGLEEYQRTRNLKSH